jgi:hypothetical protein
MILLTVLFVALANLSLATAARAQEKEPPCDGCVLLETKSFSEDDSRAARDFANSYSGPTGGTVNGVPYVYRSTVRIVRGNMGNRVIVVKIWMCPETPAAGGGKDAGKGGKDAKGDDKKKDPAPTPPNVPTFDPRFYELKDGKVVPKKDAPRPGSESGQKPNAAAPSQKGSATVPIEMVQLSLTGSKPLTPALPSRTR